MSKAVSIRFTACAVLVATVCAVAAFSKGPAVADEAPAKDRGPRAAGGGPPWQSELFKLIEPNSDGKITKEEIIAVHDKLDSDGDGAITRNELLKHIGNAGQATGQARNGRNGRPSALTLFTQFDSNKNGKLSKDEVPAPVWRHLQAADGDKDGVVTKDEFANSQRTQGAAGRGRPAGVPLEELATKLFKQFDANRDGKLAKDELPAPIWQRVVAADTNEDGIVTEAEFKTKARKSPKADSKN